MTTLVRGHCLQTNSRDCQYRAISLKLPLHEYAESMAFWRYQWSSLHTLLCSKKVVRNGLIALTLGLSCAVAAPQQCLPEDIVALAKAGYTKQEIDVMCKVDAPLFGRSGRADLTAATMTRFLNTVVPLEFVSDANTKGVLRNLTYCRADSDHHATLVAYGSIAAANQDSATATHISAAELSQVMDCALSLDDIATKLSQKGTVLGPKDFLARVGLEWIPWELRLQIEDLKAVAPSLPGTAVFPTNNIPVAIGNQVVAFSAAFYFFQDSITALLVPSTDVAGITDLSDIPRLSSFALFQASDNTPPQDARFRLTNRATQYLLDTYFSDNQAVVVETGNAQIGNLTVKQLHAGTTGVGQYGASGIVSTGSGSYSLKATAAGNDLAVQSIQIAPQSLPICPPLSVNPDSIQCNASNAAIQGAASLLGGVVTAAYKGDLVRSFAAPDTIHLKMGAIVCDLNGVVKQVSTTDEYVQVDAALSFHKPN
jgi:hypothetical protein